MCTGHAFIYAPLSFIFQIDPITKFLSNCRITFELTFQPEMVWLPQTLMMFYLTQANRYGPLKYIVHKSHRWMDIILSCLHTIAHRLRVALKRLTFRRAVIL